MFNKECEFTCHLLIHLGNMYTPIQTSKEIFHRIGKSVLRINVLLEIREMINRIGAVEQSMEAGCENRYRNAIAQRANLTTVLKTNWLVLTFYIILKCLSIKYMCLHLFTLEREYPVNIPVGQRRKSRGDHAQTRHSSTSSGFIQFITKSTRKWGIKNINYNISVIFNSKKNHRVTL